MKIFSQPQIKKWEAETMSSQNISEQNLIERAATACFKWLDEKELLNKTFHIFCGKGNNGEDGYVLAKILLWAKAKVHVYSFDDKDSTNKSNLSHLVNIHQIQSSDYFPIIENADIIIDAIFGTGLNKNISGIYEEVIKKINELTNIVISIDIASGLFADNKTETITIHPTHTLTFQSYKLDFLRPENENSTGKIHVLEIGLSEEFYKSEETVFEMPDFDEIKSLIKPRRQFSNKGDFGHAALICGSFGMMGAAVLSAKGCLAAGVGKLTCHIPKVGYQILQSTVPEAMTVVNGKRRIKFINDVSVYSAIGVGCGIGKNKGYAWLEELLKNNKAMVLDADALNWISEEPELLKSIPKNSIITPHPGEFARLFGKGNFLKLAMEKSAGLGIYILLKGKFTLIATPSGKGYFISTGNPGMAKGGMGDVLTGIITGLLAQHYTPEESCLLGAYLHGLAGDLTASQLSMQAMQPTDLINYMQKAWLMLQPEE